MQNKPILGQDLRKLYNGSKICLNINQGTRNPEWHTGVNPRTFEIMGCNSFELIDAGHLDFVDIVAGRDIIEFSGKEDLVKKIDYYLSHDDERKSIAANGYKIVKEKYTSSAIVKTLLHKIESILE
ncbi:glycosyltransferase family 1 protein [Veillonellaceae bacterium WCA-693-APC-5D-A]|uniref:Glycosyltransferase family 1 protein n=1 Tax=Anaerovibrio slackiae TaxID=2652309 RepID=A0A6I2UC28_9FIRM|nr:glycosyltransferase family 1 protein [Anaerovibrio slackiae]